MRMMPRAAPGASVSMCIVHAGGACGASVRNCALAAGLVGAKRTIPGLWRLSPVRAFYF